VAPPEVVELTGTATLEPFEKPTNYQSTETKRPTVNPGALLEKDKEKNGNQNGLLFVLGAVIVVGIVLFYLYLSKKSR
jgi:hypothetical protein